MSWVCTFQRNEAKNHDLLCATTWSRCSSFRRAINWTWSKGSARGKTGIYGSKSPWKITSDKHAYAGYSPNLCDRVLVMKSGKLIAEGTIDDLRKRVQAAQDSTLEELFLELHPMKTSNMLGGFRALYFLDSTKYKNYVIDAIHHPAKLAVWLFNTACSSYGSCLFCSDEIPLLNHHGI